MSRSVNPRPQFFDSAGDPLIAGKMYFFESGTDTAKTTYADVNLSIPNAHPVVLTGDGRLPNVFFQGTARQKLTNSADSQLWDVDSVGGDDVDVNFSEWSPLIIYNINDIVQGSDGKFYISFTNANEANDPTTTPTEWQEIQFINVWNTNVTYEIGNTVVASDNLFYISLTAANLGNDPTVDAINWGPPFSGVASISAGTGITVTGTASVPIITAINNGTVTSVTAGTGITIGGTAADPTVTADNNGTVTSVGTSGLATGGPITATGTVDVPKASSAEVATGTDDTKAVTSLAMADALLGVNNLGDVADTQTSLDTLIADNFVGSNKGTDIASAATIVIPTDGDYFELTGAGTVADMTVATNREFTLKSIAGQTFTASATIVTIDGSDLILAAGQTVTLQSTVADTVQVVSVGGVSIIGSWEFVSSVTLSAVADVAFTNMVDGYDYQYEFETILPVTDNVTFDALLGIAGPTYRTSLYKDSTTKVGAASGTSSGILSTADIALLAIAAGNGADEGIRAYIFTLFSPAVAASKTTFLKQGVHHDTGVTASSNAGGGLYTTAEAHTAIKFAFSSGNIASGLVSQYRRSKG